MDGAGEASDAEERPWPFASILQRACREIFTRPASDLFPLRQQRPLRRRLGDVGADFTGFMLGELPIVLVMRNRDVSAWYPVLLFMYPIFEMCFSIYRKKFIRGMSPGIPDGVHLHMLVYKRLMRWAVVARTARELTRRNSLTSPYLKLLCLLAVVPATLFWRRTLHLFCFAVVFALTYV
ncbi:hypothetical protein PPGU19_026140 [Paraburkholderia sp. PGU19]|nr:hypothetical protein PPGU19_026140 [Paraburkholderia sp. PGU19]